MDDEFLTAIAYLLNGPVISLFFVFGTIMNLFVIFILHFRMFRRKSCISNMILASNDLKIYLTAGHQIKKPKSVIRRYPRSKVPTRPHICIYLLWITSSDIILLTSAFFTYSVPTLFDCYQGFYAYLLPLLYTLCNATLTISVWQTFALMVDRWKALSSNFVSTISKMLETNLKINRTMCFVTLTAFLFTLPRYFEFIVKYDANTQHYSVHRSKLTSNHFYVIGYRIFGSLIFYSAFPYLLLMFLSIKICYSNKEALKTREVLTTSLRAKKFYTDSEKLFVAIIVKFLVSRLLTSALDITEQIYGVGKIFQSNKMLLVSEISNFIIIFSSTLNFFIFYKFSSLFRSSVDYFIA